MLFIFEPASGKFVILCNVINVNVNIALVWRCTKNNVLKVEYVWYLILFFVFKFRFRNLCFRTDFTFIQSHEKYYVSAISWVFSVSVIFSFPPMFEDIHNSILCFHTEDFYLCTILFRQ